MCSIFKAFLLLAIWLNYTMCDSLDDTKLVSYENMIMKEAYHFKYATSDGQMRKEMGILMNPGTPEEEFVVMGFYSYNTSDTMHIVMYRADSRGYVPKVLYKKTQKSLDRKVLQSLVG